MDAKRVEVKRVLAEHAPIIRVVVRRNTRVRLPRPVADGVQVVASVVRVFWNLLARRVYLTIE